MNLKKCLMSLILFSSIFGCAISLVKNNYHEVLAKPSPSITKTHLLYKNQDIGEIAYGSKATYTDTVGAIVSISDFSGTVSLNDGTTNNYTIPSNAVFNRADGKGDAKTIYKGINSFYFVDSPYLGEITFKYDFEIIGVKAGPTAEEVAEKFNDNIDLYCNGGINPVLTGDNSVSSTWATASSQYSQLDEEEKSKFKTIEEESLLTNIDFKTSASVSSMTDYASYVNNGTNYISSVSSLYDTTYQSDGTVQLTGSGIDANIKFFFKNDSKPLVKITKIEFIYSVTRIAPDGNIDIYGKTFSKTDELIKSVKVSETSKTSSKTMTLNFESPEAVSAISFDIVGADGPSDKVKLSKINIYSMQSSGEPTGEIAEMLSKYDYLYQKYGSTLELDNFLERNVTPDNVKKTISVIPEVENSIWIIVSVSLISLTSIGGYFFYKKRREE